MPKVDLAPRGKRFLVGLYTSRKAYQMETVKFFCNNSLMYVT